MDKQLLPEINGYIEHTRLGAKTTSKEVELLCSEAIAYNFKGVCVNSLHLARVVKALEQSKLETPPKPISVIGFPLGAVSGDALLAELDFCLGAGAKQIDMVLCLGSFLEPGDNRASRQIERVCLRAEGVPVKVILETGYLTTPEIRRASVLAADAGARYIKTSTGFGPRGASLDDVRTIKSELERTGHFGVGIKASGGIKTLRQCIALIKAGATAIGSSGGVAIVGEQKQKDRPGADLKD